MVAAGDAADPATVALVRAAKRALDPDAVVLALEAAAPTDDAAAEMAKAQHADAVIVARWEGEQAHLRVRFATGEWAQRDIVFAPTDSREERGRTVGLVAATMLQAEPHPMPSPPAHPTPTPEAAPPIARPRFALEAGAGSTAGLSAPGWNLGPSFVASVRVVSVVWAHVATQLRFGPHDQAAANATWFVGGPALGVRVPTGSLFFGGRVEIDVVGVSLARPGTSGGRVTGGVTVMAELGWHADRFGVRVGAGLETSFENTAVYVNGDLVGHLPTSRLRFEAGWFMAF